MNRDDLRTARRIGMRSGTAGWYHIGNTTTGQPTRVDIYDEIGFWGVKAQQFVRDIGNVRGDLELHINSPGGDVFDGVAIYNALLQHRGQVTVVIDGLAASAASFIAQAASPGKLLIARTATIMIHNGFGLVIGDASDMRKMADVLDKQTRNIASIYAERSGKPIDHWTSLMNAESWFIGAEAVDVLLADRVLDVDAVPVGNWDLTVFRNAPNVGRSRNAAKGGSGMEGHSAYSGRHEHEHPSYDGMGNTHSHGHTHEGDASHSHDHGTEGQGGSGGQNAATVPYVSRHETRHIPMTGEHEHDHAAMDADDHDDGIHTHMHTHTGDATHAHSHGAAPMTNSADDVITFDPVSDLLPEWMIRSSAYDDTAWDGPAAMKAAANSDNPASALASICAGRREGPADEEHTYALPHHKTPGGPPNRNGVNNALSRLPQTEGLTNASAAESHLHSHQKLWADGDGTSTGNTWQDAAGRVGTQMAELLRGRQPVADPPGGE